MASVAEAFVTVRPDVDKFGSELSSKLGGAAKLAGKALLGVGVAAAAGAAASVKAFAGLQQGMNEVFTLLPGISGDAMKDMTGQVKDFAKDFGVLPKEVVPALYQSLSAGVPQDNVFEFLETAQKAAKGGVTDLTTAVDGISSVVNAYGDDVIDATHASDLMFTAVRLGKTDFGQLSSTLYNVIPTAAALGVQFGDVAAGLATMTAQGIPTAQATTQLRQLFNELSKAGGETAETFEKLSGQSFKEFIDAGGNTQEALLLLEEHAAELGIGINDLFGSVEAGGAALALTGEATDTFRGNLEEMGDAAGATQGAFDQMNQGLSVAWEKIKTNLSVLFIDIGEKLAPTVQRAADAVLRIWGDLTRGWREGTEEITGPGGVLEDVIGGNISMGAELREKWDSLVQWWEDNGPTIRQWFADLRDWFAETGKKIKDWWEDDAKPAIEEFRAAIDEHWPKVEELFAKLGEVVGNVADIFKTEVGNMSSSVEEGESSMSEDVGSLLDTLNALATTVETVTSAVATSWDVLTGAVTGNFGRLAEGLDDLSGNRMSAFRDRIGDKLDDVVGWFRLLPGRIVAGLGKLGGLLVESGRDLVRGLWDGIRGMGSWLWDKVYGFMTANIPGPVKKALGISSPSKLMMEMGGYTIDGLVRGMDARLIDLQGASERAAAAALPNIPAVSFGQSVAGGTAPSDAPQMMDPQKWGRIAAREIGRELKLEARTR